jgi:short subunit fatty acids transporter
VGVDIPAEAPVTLKPPGQYSLLQRLTAFFVRLFERYTPDPYILAEVLSILTAVLAALLAPRGSITTIFTGWYNGLFSISAFAFQVLLILVTGYALSTSKPIRALLSRVASLLISLFVPSAGGHWAVQGPFAVPAAVGLHASQAATAMGVAYGEQVAGMIQPLWALPVVAVAGISIRQVMGFTVMSFLVGMILFGAALLLLA